MAAQLTLRELVEAREQARAALGPIVPWHILEQAAEEVRASDPAFRGQAVKEQIMERAMKHYTSGLDCC